jgi:predicted HTH domain antitoxin
MSYISKDLKKRRRSIMTIGILTDNIIEKGIETIVQTDGYPNREAVLQEAFRLFLQTYPEYRLMMATRLYQDGLVTLKWAAEISGLASSDFEAVLQARGIEVLMSAKESFRQGWQEAMTDDTRPIPELSTDVKTDCNHQEMAIFLDRHQFS